MTASARRSVPPARRIAETPSPARLANGARAARPREPLQPDGGGLRLPPARGRSSPPRPAADRLRRRPRSSPRGRTQRTKLEIAEELESRGARPRLSADASRSGRRGHRGIVALARRWRSLLDRLIEILRTPVFPAEELEKEKKRLVGAIRQAAGPDRRAARTRPPCARVYPDGPSVPPADRRRSGSRSVEALAREELRGLLPRSATARRRCSSWSSGTSTADRILDGLEAARVLEGRPGTRCRDRRSPPACAGPGDGPRCRTRRAPTS